MKSVDNSIITSHCTGELRGLPSWDCDPLNQNSFKKSHALPETKNSPWKYAVPKKDISSSNRLFFRSKTTSFREGSYLEYPRNASYITIITKSRWSFVQIHLSKITCLTCWAKSTGTNASPDGSIIHRIHGTIVYLPIHEWLICMVN